MIPSERSACEDGNIVTTRIINKKQLFSVDPRKFPEFEESSRISEIPKERYVHQKIKNDIFPRNTPFDMKKNTAYILARTPPYEVRSQKAASCKKY